MVEDRKKLNVIDLFCGCGGLSYGFEMAGYRVLLGVDNWKDALITFQRNHAKSKIMYEDISLINGQDITDYIGCNRDDIDVIIGGPPCQGFSLSGKRDINDPRNKLYESFVRIVADIRPKAFLMENVPGIAKLYKGKVKEQILEDFTSIGYKVSVPERWLNAADYGVPQMRRRVFFVGLKDDYFEFPSPEYGGGFLYKPYITSEEAIGDLPLLDNEIGEEGMPYTSPPMNDYQREMRKNSDAIYNHIATIHKPKTVDIISMVPDGGSYKDLPKELWNVRRVNIAWTRMNSKEPCFTIDTGHNHHFHYKANRVPTVRESARIQSFPDDFIFAGGKVSQLRQVGNAVPPLLAKALAEKLKKYL